MGDTFKGIIEFISNDPLMMILCGAIAVLIIVFLIVLIFGKNDNKNKEEIMDNTSSLLTPTDDSALRSTQEISTPVLGAQENLEQTINVPEIESATLDMQEKDAPITIDEALNMKETRENNAIKDTIEIPVVNNDTIEPLVANEVPAAQETETPEMNIFDQANKMDTPVDNIGSMQFENNVQSSTNNSNEPIESVNENIESTNSTLIDEQTSTLDSSDEDIDLPKLNTSNENTVISSLTGESFDIK